ncbi:MAG: ABC transporter substrate-binding protein [Deltaproteobacteria bacterium]|nr:ABC transporter substrate-binding protein [Deltaproteobacteria bacterium]
MKKIMRLSEVKMNRTRFALLLGTLLYCLLVSALPDTGLAQGLSKVAIIRPSPSVPGINLHVAQQRGFFREEGLDLQLVQLSDIPAIKALTAGEVQAVSIVGSVVRAIERDDAPLKVLSIDLKRPLFWLVARPEYKSIADLKGKVLGVASRGGGPHLVAARLLRKGGLDPEKDIAVIVTKDTLQSLVSGDIQATVLLLPSVILARDNFKMNILASSVEEFSLERGLAVREDLLREKRDLIKRMLRALAKARRYVLENERGSSELLADWTKVELPVALESYRLARPSFTTDGIPTEEEVWEYLKGRLSKPVPADRIFDFSLQREVNRELGVR